MTTLRIGMGQMLVVGGDLEANMSRALSMVRQAAEARCDVVVLPECLDVGWTHPSARELASPIPGPQSDRILAASRNHGIYVVAGLTEREGDRVYNAAIMTSPDGEILLKHRKINILDIARDLYAVGNGLSVAETPWGCVGLLVCADNFPEMSALGSSLAHMGARVVLSPCAWAVPPDHDNDTTPYGDLWTGSYSALAKAHGLTTVGVSNVGWLSGGPWKGHRCIGCSLAVWSDGTVLEMAPYGVEAAGLHVLEIPRLH